MEYLDKLNIILNHYTPTHQILKCVEELEELKVELQAKPINKVRTTDEIADVLVTVVQVAEILDIKLDDVLNRCKFKIDRQIKRIEKEKSNG